MTKQMKLSKSYLNHFLKDRLETSMKGSNFIFDRVNFLYCTCHKINLNHNGSQKSNNNIRQW